MTSPSSFGFSGFGGTGGGDIRRFSRFCWKTQNNPVKVHTVQCRHLSPLSPLPWPHHVLIGHNEPLHPLLPHPEHLGALVVEQGELLQHYILRRLDLGAQIQLGALIVWLIVCQQDRGRGGWQKVSMWWYVKHWIGLWAFLPYIKH